MANRDVSHPLATLPGRGAGLLVLWLGLWLSGCGAAARTSARDGSDPGSHRAAPATVAAPQLGENLLSLPQRIDSPEEASSARRTLDYLYLGEPGRAALQKELLRFHTGQARAHLDQGHPEEAYEEFGSALGVFDPAELQDPAHPPHAPDLLALAQGLDAAFRRRGAHPEVVTALMVQQTLAPADQTAQRRYHQLGSWLAGELGQSPPWRGQKRGLSALSQDPPPALIRDLEGTVRVWPARVVVQELGALYLAEAQSFGLAGSLSGPRDAPGRMPRDFLNLQGLQPRTPASLPAYKVVRLYLRVSRPAEALAAVKQLGKLSPPERVLVGLVEEAMAPGAQPVEWIKIAGMLAQNPDDLDVSLEVCRSLGRRAPQLAAAHLCVGDLAFQLERKGLSIRALEQARALLSSDRIIWEKLGQLYQDRLSDLVGDERTTELEGALKQIEAYYARLHQQFPEQPVGLSMSAALAEVGRGYYNAGRISDAVRFLERSVAVEPNAAALELLGTVQLKRGQGAEALATLERARAVELMARRGEPLFKVYFKARIGRLIAEALDLQNDASAAEVRRQSLRDWGQLVDNERLQPRQRAEAELERGKLHYLLGERAEALAAFQRAVDDVPEEGQGPGAGKDQGQVYADTIAFLVQQGELEEALDAYHRALGRARVVEYLKVYCSLWVNDLAQRSGQPDDPLATAYLKSIHGGKWYAELARWATGQEREDTLLQRADTAGKKAEASFYLGMQKLRAGSKKEGEALLRSVLGSDMMAFFEYEMAARYLRRGAPTAPAIKPRPRSSAQGSAPGKPDRRPPGSI